MIIVQGLGFRVYYSYITMILVIVQVPTILSRGPKVYTAHVGAATGFL